MKKETIKNIINNACKKQQVVISVLTVITIAGFVLFRYLPLKNKRMEMKQTRNKQSLIIEKSNVEVQQLPMAKERLKQLQGKVLECERRIPTGRELGPFVQQVTKFMSEQNLVDQQIKPEDEFAIDKINCIPVRIEGRGSLQQIFDFYTELQSMDRLVRVKELKLISGEKLGGSIVMRTEVLIYYNSNAGNG